MLVYEYGKTFTVDKDTTIECFVGSIPEKSLDMSPTRLEAMKELVETSPQGKVCEFFSAESTDLQAGITISDSHERITVVFRGSESAYDWFHDMYIFKKTLHGRVRVHKGFHRQLHGERMYETIVRTLRRTLAEHPNYQVFVTGHSLGAALSTIFGYELARDIPNQVTVVSFASPRVGNAAFRNQFDEQENLTHFRITNHRDIVTAIPMINYKHVGINIALTKDSYVVYAEYNYSWYWASLLRCWSIKDHYMDLMYQRLKKVSW
jgi:predicted lipase